MQLLIYKRKGFTLIEIMIAMAIIAILAAVIIVSYNSLKEKSRMAGLLKLEAQINNALADSIIGHWKLDDEAGGTAVNSAGSVDGNINGAQGWEAIGSDECIHGGCIQLDGSGSNFIDIPGITTLAYESQRSFTLMVWFRPIADTDMGIADGEPHPAQNISWYASSRAQSTGLYFYCFTQMIVVTMERYCGQNNDQLKPNQKWHLLIITYDEGAFASYIDGRKDSTKLFPTPQDPNSQSLITVGRAGSDPDFTGFIDDVYLFHEAIDLTGST